MILFSIFSAGCLLTTEYMGISEAHCCSGTSMQAPPGRPDDILSGIQRALVHLNNLHVLLGLRQSHSTAEVTIPACRRCWGSVHLYPKVMLTLSVLCENEPTRRVQEIRRLASVCLVYSPPREDPASNTFWSMLRRSVFNSS